MRLTLPLRGEAVSLSSATCSHPQTSLPKQHARVGLEQCIIDMPHAVRSKFPVGPRKSRRLRQLAELCEGGDLDKPALD